MYYLLDYLAALLEELHLIDASNMPRSTHVSDTGIYLEPRGLEPRVCARRMATAGAMRLIRLSNTLRPDPYPGSTREKLFRLSRRFWSVFLMSVVWITAFGPPALADCGFLPLKPLAPLGCADLIPRCICEEGGYGQIACRWEWLCIRDSRDTYRRQTLPYIDRPTATDAFNETTRRLQEQRLLEQQIELQRLQIERERRQLQGR